MLYTFTLNKFYGYLLSIEQNKLVFLKAYCIEFDDIAIAFADEKKRTELICHFLLTNRDDTLFNRTKNKKVCQRMWIFVIWKKLM